MATKPVAVEFDAPAQAEAVVKKLNGHLFHGSKLSVKIDPGVAGGAGVLVQGLPRGTSEVALQALLEGATGQKRAAEGPADGAPPKKFAPRRAFTEQGDCVEVMYEQPDVARKAAEFFEGGQLQGRTMYVTVPGPKVEKDLKKKSVIVKKGEQAPREPRDDRGCKVIVHGLGEGFSHSDLMDAFGEVGKVRRLKILDPSKAEFGRGPSRNKATTGDWGEVVFSSATEARNVAVDFNGAVWTDDSPIAVEHDILDPAGRGDKVIVAGIPEGTHKDELKTYFAEAGTVLWASFRGEDEFLKGEIKFESNEHRDAALANHDGWMGEHEISVEADGYRPNVLWVSGLPAGGDIFEVRKETQEHFEKVGAVAFCKIDSPKSFKERDDERQAQRTQDTAARARRQLAKGRSRYKAEKGDWGEVQFRTAEEAKKLAEMFQKGGTWTDGSPIAVFVDEEDPAIILVTGVPEGADKEELRAYFAEDGAFIKGTGFRGDAPDQILGAEIKFREAHHRDEAVTQFNGTVIGKHKITVEADPFSRNMVTVSGLPPTYFRRMTQEHFEKIGPIAFLKVDTPENFEARKLEFRVRRPRGGPIAKKGDRGEVVLGSGEEAQYAATEYNGGLWSDGNTIEVSVDAEDGMKLLVRGVPEGTEQEELRAYFAEVGRVKFATFKADVKDELMMAEMMYSEDNHRDEAIERFDNTFLLGKQIFVEPDEIMFNKIWVMGLPTGSFMGATRAHFDKVGRIYYCRVDVPSNFEGGEDWVKELAAKRAAKVPDKAKEKEQADARAAAMKKIRLGMVQMGSAPEVVVAFEELDGTDLDGSIIALEMDPKAKDGTKVLVHGVPSSVSGPRLRDFFSTCGMVKFANTRPLTPVEEAEWLQAEAAAAMFEVE